MIVDSSALVAIARREPGFDSLVDQLTESTVPIRISSANYLEAFIVIDRTDNPVLVRRLEAIVRYFEIILEPFTPEQAVIARRAYADFGRGSGHPANLNFGDCFAYALAIDRNEPLLYKGDAFVHTDVRKPD